MVAQVPIRGLEGHTFTHTEDGTYNVSVTGLSPTGCKEPLKCFKQERNMVRRTLWHRNYGGNVETEQGAGAEWDGQLVPR